MLGVWSGNPQSTSHSKTEVKKCPILVANQNIVVCEQELNVFSTAIYEIPTFLSILIVIITKSVALKVTLTIRCSL